MTVSAGLQQTAIAELQRLMSHKKVTAADLATLRLEDRPAYRKLLDRVFRYEEAFQLMTIYDIDSGNESIWTFVNLSFGERPPKRDRIGDSPIAFLHRVFLLPGELESLRRISREMREAETIPFAEATVIWKQCETQARIQGGLFLNLFTPPVNGFGQSAARADAARLTAQLGVAAYFYREKTGRLPKNLNDLVPDFVASVPADPFDGQPMKLKRTDHSIIIYSVGPDEVDDAGIPWDAVKQKGDVIFEVPDGSR